jgi:hypothetical protein
MEDGTKEIGGLGGLRCHNGIPKVSLGRFNVSMIWVPMIPRRGNDN